MTRIADFMDGWFATTFHDPSSCVKQAVVEIIFTDDEVGVRVVVFVSVYVMHHGFGRQRFSKNFFGFYDVFQRVMMAVRSRMSRKPNHRIAKIVYDSTH